MIAFNNITYLNNVERSMREMNWYFLNFDANNYMCSQSKW